MTEPPPKTRNKPLWRRFHGWALLCVLLAGLGLRLHGVGFGLPALNDPDEPLFMMTAFEMLKRGSFNPEWFGHPATTTLYSLALVMIGVGVVGLGSGRYADLDALGAAAYADPGVVWLPARVMIVVCGVICIYLTWRLGRRLGGEKDGARLGLVAALFLAVNAVHVHYSQIVRTDVQTSLFMLLCTLSALAILREGKTRDYLLAGVFAGLACATKWPGAIVGLSPLCAGLYRMSQGKREWRGLALLGAAAGVTLFAVSPFLLLDYQTVLRNLAGEARPVHPGATGGGFFANLGWYVSGPLLASLGWGGLVLAAVGLIWPGGGRRAWLVAVLPGCAATLLIISGQALVWERWIVPILPFAALAAARGLCAVADLARDRLRRPLRGAEAVAALALAVPMALTAVTGNVERNNDTRQIASAWVRAHVPAGRSILMEHAGIDLLSGPWSFRFPLGSAGCIDARAALQGKIEYSKVERVRGGSPIVDLGNLDPALLPSCRADYAVITHYDRYRTDPAHFGREIASYERIMAGGRELVVIRPEAGVSSGPIVRIVELRR